MHKKVRSQRRGSEVIPDIYRKYLVVTPTINSGRVGSPTGTVLQTCHGLDHLLLAKANNVRLLGSPGYTFESELRQEPIQRD